MSEKKHADVAIEMLKEWLEFAQDKFGEFDLDDEDDCASDHKLCPQCESNGCIQRKIRLTRALVAPTQEAGGRT